MSQILDNMSSQLLKIAFVLLTVFSSIDTFGQIMTFDFAGIAGDEVSAPSNSNDPNISAGTITRGAGLTASNNADRFNATNWALTSIPNAVTNNDYMQFTITPTPGCNFSVSSIFIRIERSGTGPSAVALRSSADGFAANLDAIYPIVDNTSPQTFTFTFTQTAVAVATTYRFYMFAEAIGGSGGIGDGAGNDIIVNGSTSCSASNSITTGAITTAPFTVDCTAPTTDAGSVAFTSSGTFGGTNIYSVQLSDAAGSFLSPTVIGTLASTANSGSINFTIPAATPTGSGYLMRVVSDNPLSIGSNSAAFTITQTTPCVVQTPTTPGLIINEWSNGPAGNQEFYEFVVAGQCGTIVDIRGYILDDNNGTFTTPSAYSGTASGIAPGHFRFSNAAQWASIPVGSLIVIYNNFDPNPALPGDDPTDANNDSLYVIPHDNALFERCTTLPDVNSPDSTYSPCTYATSPLTGWGPLSLNNTRDAIQVRNPDGSYYHGVSYGGAAMSGGPHNLKLFTGDGTGMAGWFSDGNFFDVSNWSSGAAVGNETPGLPNNAANAAWLLAIRDPLAVTCPIVLLPVELADFDGEKHEEGNLLYWETQSEHNSSYFTLERSIDIKQWDVINMQPAAGNSQNLFTYSFIDRGFTSGAVNYYRLVQTDIDGEVENFGKIVSIDNRIQLVQRVKIVNLLGQEINENTTGVQIHVFSDGTTTKYLKQ